MASKISMELPRTQFGPAVQEMQKIFFWKVASRKMLTIVSAFRIFEQQIIVVQTSAAAAAAAIAMKNHYDIDHEFHVHRLHPRKKNGNKKKSVTRAEFDEIHDGHLSNFG